MAVSVNRRFGNHYQIIASYTLGKAIDDTTDISQNLGPQDPTKTRLERGLSLFDARHRLSVAGMLESPFQRGTGTWYSRALADFVLSPIVTAPSGHPFNIRPAWIPTLRLTIPIALSWLAAIRVAVRISGLQTCAS